MLVADRLEPDITCAESQLHEDGTKHIRLMHAGPMFTLGGAAVKAALTGTLALVDSGMRSVATTARSLAMVWSVAEIRTAVSSLR